MSVFGMTYHWRLRRRAHAWWVFETCEQNPLLAYSYGPLPSIDHAHQLVAERKRILRDVFSKQFRGLVGEPA